MRKRFPFATMLLSLLILATYFLLSGGTLYIPDQMLRALGFNYSLGLAGILSYMFVHIGIIHLLGNIIPLAVFGFIIERKAGTAHALAIFLLAGLLPAALFSLLNPAFFLVGASAAVAGLMSACALTKPIKTVVILLIIPFVLSYAVFPLAGSLAVQQRDSLLSEKHAITESVVELVKQNRSEEAAALNATLMRVEQRQEAVERGMEREKKTPVDVWVHVFGAVVGAAYVIAFARSDFDDGMDEYGRMIKFVFKNL
jgi:membrane associated rhomboid family serine protease